LLGINVINADKYNMNSSFKYSYTPKTLKEYKNVILNLHKFKSLINNKNDIYKFYYMHHYWLFPKKLYFKDKKNKLKANYFTLKESKLRNTLENKIENFLNINHKYMLEDYKLKIIDKIEKN
jgi:hypothetical protein